MVFPSYVFLLFFLPLVLVLYYGVFHKIEHRNIILLIASLFFYAWGEPLFAFAMLACIFVNWAFGLFLIYSQRLVFRKPFFILVIIANLSLLAVFKYAAFIVTNINRLPWFDMPVPTVTLPIGISFFTFQAMSYTIDAYRGKVMPQKKFSHIALYISLFPQLVAGPIVRYQTIENELYERGFSWDSFTKGMSRFIIGLGKKVIIANTIALAADLAFSPPPKEFLLLRRGLA